MLGAHVGVVEVAGLGHRELEHFLGARRVGELAQGDGGLPLADRLLYALVDLLEVHVEVREHRGRHSLAFPDEAQQDVLRADVVVLEADGFLTRHRQHLPHPVSEVVVHGSSGMLVAGLGRPGD